MHLCNFSGALVTTKPLPCSCCPRPFAELVKFNNGSWGLVVLSRHHESKKHPNVITLAQLEAMIKELEAQDKAAV
jgi:hypothetical protein